MGRQDDHRNRGGICQDPGELTDAPACAEVRVGQPHQKEAGLKLIAMADKCALPLEWTRRWQLCGLVSLGGRWRCGQFLFPIGCLFRKFIRTHTRSCTYGSRVAIQGGVESTIKMQL